MVRFLIPFAAVASIGGVVAAGVASEAIGAEKRPSPRERVEAQFHRDIARLKPQPPVDCIDTRWSKSSLSAVGSKLIYRVGRNRMYVSDTAGGCEQVARGDALVTRQFGTRLCRGDIATTINAVARIETGSCVIGSFTPYVAR